MSISNPKAITATDLTLEEKLKLFSGSDAWNFQGVERLGIPPMQVADCGHGVTLVAPPYGSATCFPTSVGMAATWNQKLLVEVGQVLGRETRAKGCGMLLGPMVNLHRLPCGGRTYETFSEDPILTGKLGAAIIRGIQSEGAGACAKSFSCNNQQTNQSATSSEVDSKTLREIYFKIFAVIFRESMPWATMTSYNKINGEYPADSHYLLEEVLRKELGFDGIVVSDWNAVDSLHALESGLDIEMPGPAKILTLANFKAALDDGRLTIEEVDKRANRLLAMHAKAKHTLTQSDGFSPPELNSKRHGETARRVAEESAVLLKNEGQLLPFNPKKIKKIAVIGPNAATSRLGGGGSASVLPPYDISVLKGIQQLAAGEDFEVVYAEGCSLFDDTSVVPPEVITQSASPESPSGLKASYYKTSALKNEGLIETENNAPMIDFSWGWAAPTEGIPRNGYVVTWEGYLHHPKNETVSFTLSTNEGIGRVWFNDALILDCWSAYNPGNFEDNYTNRRATGEFTFTGNQPVAIRVEYQKTGTRGGIRFAWKQPGSVDNIATAAQLAQDADCAVVVGGLSNMFEGGNCDRKEFELPGRQEALIQAVVAANPKTAVVLYNATPVSFKGWRDQIPAILEAFYPGQEGGAAIARILFGLVNPSGKLPDTIPNNWEEVPAMQYFPGENDIAPYAEGKMVGYRHYDKIGLVPEFPFGFGLSYTQFAYSLPQLIQNRVQEGNLEIEIALSVTNTGERTGKETVQLYLERIDPASDEPIRELLDFSKIELEPGVAQKVHFKIEPEDLRSYNPETQSWELTLKSFKLAVGSHSRDLQAIEVTLP